MKICICDDDELQMLKTREIVESSIEKVHDLSVVLYDPNNLEFDVDAYRFECDILIMDIYFQGCDFDGIKLAQKINERLPNCRIIFLSAFLEYAPEVYDVEHVWFVWKKNMDIMLEKAIHKALSYEVNDRTPDTISFFSEGKRIFIRQNDIMYAERLGRKIEIITNSVRYCSYLSLTELSKQLHSDFKRATGWCVINLKYVKSVNGNVVELENMKTVTLGRRFEVPFKKAYMEYVTRQV